jgi:hypothetical protein
MIEETLKGIESGIENLYDAIHESKVSDFGTTMEDSLEYISQSLFRIAELLEKIEAKMK